MTDVPNPLNIRNIRLIAGGPGGEKAKRTFGKQALQMLKQGHLANAQLPSWRMRRYVNDDRGNIVVISIKSIFGLDTIEFSMAPEIPEFERKAQTEYHKKSTLPGGRREFFPAIRVFDKDGTQLGFITSREPDSLLPPWDFIPLPFKEGTSERETELEAGFTDWRQGQYSRPDTPYEGRSYSYPKPDPKDKWGYAIDLSVPSFKDELWIYRDVEPAHDRSFVDVDWEAINPINVNRPPLPYYKWEFVGGGWDRQFHAPHPTHYYVSGLERAIYDYGNYVRTGIALGSGDGLGTPTANIFRELSGYLHNAGTALCSNFQTFTLKEAFDWSMGHDDGVGNWTAVHDPLGLDPETDWSRLPPEHNHIGWWSAIISEVRIGTVYEHLFTSTQAGPQLYTRNFFGTWANEGFALLQVHISHHSVTLSEREYFPDDIDNFPWHLTSITKDNPCLQEYAACSLQERFLMFHNERTVIDQPTNYSEYFEVDNRMHLIGSGGMHPPSEYGSKPGVRVQQVHPRYYQSADETVRAMCPLKRHLFEEFEYHYFIHNKDGSVEKSKVTFPGYTYISKAGEDGFMHEVVGDIQYRGEELTGSIYANSTTRLFERIVLEMTYEEKRILFDADGPPRYSSTTERP